MEEDAVLPLAQLYSDESDCEPFEAGRIGGGDSRLAGNDWHAHAVPEFLMNAEERARLHCLPQGQQLGEVLAYLRERPYLELLMNEDLEESMQNNVVCIEDSWAFKSSQGRLLCLFRWHHTPEEEETTVVPVGAIWLAALQRAYRDKRCHVVDQRLVIPHDLLSRSLLDGQHTHEPYKRKLAAPPPKAGWHWREPALYTTLQNRPQHEQERLLYARRRLLTLIDTSVDIPDDLDDVLSHAALLQVFGGAPLAIREAMIRLEVELFRRRTEHSKTLDYIVWMRKQCERSFHVRTDVTSRLPEIEWSKAADAQLDLSIMAALPVRNGWLRFESVEQMVTLCAPVLLRRVIRGRLQCPPLVNITTIPWLRHFAECVTVDGYISMRRRDDLLQALEKLPDAEEEKEEDEGERPTKRARTHVYIGPVKTQPLSVDVEDLFKPGAAAMPPCMMALNQKLRRLKHLKNMERFGFASGLLDVGVEPERMMRYMARHWDTDSFEKEHSSLAKLKPKFSDMDGNTTYGLGCQKWASSTRKHEADTPLCPIQQAAMAPTEAEARAILEPLCGGPEAAIYAVHQLAHHKERGYIKDAQLCRVVCFELAQKRTEVEYPYHGPGSMKAHSGVRSYHERFGQ